MQIKIIVAKRKGRKAAEDFGSWLVDRVSGLGHQDRSIVLSGLSGRIDRVYLQLVEPEGKPTGDGGGGGGCSKSLLPEEMYFGWLEDDCMARWMSRLSVETESCFVDGLVESAPVLGKGCMV
ncbi:hypothetical protein H112_05498 [Trichophyton rubrum D6]|uniref:Uncharacterized protein n=1 Tax=Trichophyton rubrum (strain ATCC MYA-4607 / CBS 118892) TaxID=559305 RepID=A0A080WIB7_TRIRC|nr:uncharacterized protein TERG_11968 [Trichophyton rubrum CBS 118892]EZG04415.1 hypothetical protein H106_05346 [Trichophyton rubrum CBS 735.88]KDB32311.1 hypothetical protein H112_05498 [Trichophyton rubrum D6]KFL61129.1 hypothetical protein TERG_11968 [Trichophyton rubrum CBS 118892]